MSGKLYGVGVGPGASDLITLRAHKIITQSKIIAYPAPDSGASFARSIVEEFLSADKIEIPIVIPMRTERFPAKGIYDVAAEKIYKHLKNGEDVVVLCEGDPFFYGSFMYLFERLCDDFEVEIVPGISSLMASAGALKRPLAARNDVLKIIPAPNSDEDIRSQLADCDCAAIIKVGRHFDRVKQLLNEMGLTQYSAYLERVSLGNQQILPMTDVRFDAAPYFSMILIYKGSEDWVSNLKVGSKS